ncbi:MAG: GTP cyclohydrolase I FolE [Anaerolineae bacterium CG_4_9_14_3_um_filter_57_17]|nr:GTP cyclohydrolase I FolE [bacterium]NCT21917.1 GTP cyclohydrolase I FolE [bacterium]PJB65957.1 MAG: GTP cyclohydrolase I FolE [Anaerolineae bacterium CG_4_9_14_3_um_filter_57_17]
MGWLARASPFLLSKLMPTTDFDEFDDTPNTPTSLDLTVIETAVAQILAAVGEDPARDGLLRTPQRVARMYTELLAGYTTDPVALVNGAIFEVQYDEMVIVRDIEFYSLCEHHMLPFMGRAHVAYIPNGKVLGLSKIPRIVDMYARRLQVQEHMTRQIADFLRDLLKPQGVAVVVEAMHLCSMMRGVKKHDARMTTSAMHGAFRANLATRQEFLDNISRGASALHI